MAIKKPDWNKLREKLKTVYRFQIVDEKSYDVKLVVELNRLNVIVATGLLLFFFTVLNFLLIAFTPLKQYIPGYGSSSGRKEVVRMSVRAQELEEKMNAQQKYVVNLQNILNDKIVVDAVKSNVQKVNADTGILSIKTADETEFIKSIEKGIQNATLLENIQDTKVSVLSNLTIKKPVSGNAINVFSVQSSFINFAANANEEVKAVLSGNVILVGNSVENGNYIVIQSENQLVYILKNNANILKKTGNFVNIGETIGTVGKLGNTGKYVSTLELWYKGQPINPLKFIK
jgi:murein DD-endopeptidase MepM/ murein hydrolase activator NlpD